MTLTRILKTFLKNTYTNLKHILVFVNIMIVGLCVVKFELSK